MARQAILLEVGAYVEYGAIDHEIFMILFCLVSCRRDLSWTGGWERLEEGGSGGRNAYVTAH